MSPTTKSLTPEQYDLLRRINLAAMLNLPHLAASLRAIYEATYGPIVTQPAKRIAA